MDLVSLWWKNDSQSNRNKKRIGTRIERIKRVKADKKNNNYLYKLRTNNLKSVLIRSIRSIRVPIS